MRKPFISLAMGLLLTIGLTGAGFAAEAAVGNWRDTERGGVVKLYECDGGICIQVVTSAVPNSKDEHNPTEALRSRPIAGLTIMTSAKKSAENTWKGDVYNTEDGKTYTGSVKLTSPDQLQMQGCVLSIFCKTRTFTRVK